MTKYEDLPCDGNGDIDPYAVEFPVEIPLLRPVEAEGRKLESLSLRAPTALDLELCWKHGNEITRVIHLLASLAELAPDEVRALGAADFARAAEAAGASL